MEKTLIKSGKELNGDDAYLAVHDIYKEIKKIEVNLKEVDEKLYMGKQSGRDKIVY